MSDGAFNLQILFFKCRTFKERWRMGKRWVHDRWLDLSRSYYFFNKIYNSEKAYSFNKFVNKLICLSLCFENRCLKLNHLYNKNKMFSFLYS